MQKKIAEEVTVPGIAEAINYFEEYPEVHAKIDISETLMLIEALTESILEGTE